MPYGDTSENYSHRKLKEDHFSLESNCPTQMYEGYEEQPYIPNKVFDTIFPTKSTHTQ